MFGDDMPGNGRDLNQANLDQLFYGRYRGLWTKEQFFGKHETSFCIKSKKRLLIPNDDYKRSNVAPSESYKMSEQKIFPLQPFEHQ